MYTALAVVLSSMHLVVNVNRRTGGRSCTLIRHLQSLQRIQDWMCSKTGP